MLSRHAHRGFHPRLLMLLPFGEHGRVKPLRVSLVEPVACAKAVTGASHLYQNLWVKAPSSRPQSSSSICAGPVAPGQPGSRARPAKAERSADQQAGDGPGVGAERNLRSFLEQPTCLLGRGFSSCLVRPSDAQPSGAMKKVARMLRVHEPLLLNWFRAKGEISAGAVEGLNNKIRVMTRRSYGFDREPPPLHSSLRRSPFPGS